MEVLGNKVILITGGAGALGLVTAKLYLAKGSSVMLADRDPEGLQRAVRMLNTDRLACVVADVTKTADTRLYVNETVRLFGKIDVFIHCVGILGMIRPVEQVAEEELSYAKWLNFSGTWLGCHYVLPVMNDGGSVILVSSTAGHRAPSDNGRYTESKYAIVRMMRTLSLQVAHRKIRVNTIDPINFEGRMMRDPEEVLISGNRDELKKIMGTMIPLGRYVQPEEVAHSLLFFGSVNNTYITGTTHVIAGGFNS